MLLGTAVAEGAATVLKAKHQPFSRRSFLCEDSGLTPPIPLLKAFHGSPASSSNFLACIQCLYHLDLTLSIHLLYALPHTHTHKTWEIFPHSHTPISLFLFPNTQGQRLKIPESTLSASLGFHQWVGEGPSLAPHPPF